MLRFLRVRNFALIDQLELHFGPGFNLLSGETGAGKSILIDAVGLLTGAKASAGMIRSGESRAIVEAVFETDLRRELDRFGLDAEGFDVIVRREIAADDRNRVFVNNQPTTVAVLKELAPALLDIHGQHEQQTLLDAGRQLALLDVFAGLQEAAAAVAELHHAIGETESALRLLSLDHTQKRDRLDLLGFELAEIQKVDPKPDEADESRQRLDVLLHSGKLLEAATRCFESLYESEAPVTAALAHAGRTLRDAGQHDERLLPFVEQIESARILVQDIAYGLRDYAGRIETDPKEAERLQSRLAELERLHRKYGPDLLAHADKIKAEMDSLGLSETKKSELTEKIEALNQAYAEAASALSRKRRAAAVELEARTAAEMQSLAMPNVRFRIHWTDVLPGRSTGIDRAEFLISANPGEEPRPLDKIASGGELSRIMLALRTVLTADRDGQTLVFDEVDAGIGGKAAETVGRKLQELASRYQILCVTHLAQIAAFAGQQYRIEKHVRDGRTVTRVEPLSGEARIDELARMMSGSRVTAAAREHVKELLAGGKG